MDGDWLRRRLVPPLERRIFELGAAPGESRPAAVLVALQPGPDGGVLLTRRTAHLPNHAGQVSLPGGTIDPGDPTPEAAALREAEEEIGLDPRQVEVIGRLDEFVLATGFHIIPVTALLKSEPALRPSPDEVAAIFRLGFKTLLDPALPEWRTATWRGGTRQFPVWPHPDHVIWGATAWILHRLSESLRATL